MMMMEEEGKQQPQQQSPLKKSMMTTTTDTTVNNTNNDSDSTVDGGLSELQNLLTALGEDPLPLSFIARYAAVTSSIEEVKDSDIRVDDATQYMEAFLFTLFERHVGPLDDVLNGMVRVFSSSIHDEILYQNFGQTWDDDERYNCPINQTILGPVPDLLLYT
jgi:hypothetical protein